MGLKLGFVAIGVWILTGCAPAGKSGDFRASARYTKGTTGGADSEGFSFIHNGDHRVDQALHDEPPAAPAAHEDMSEPESIEPTPVDEPKSVSPKTVAPRHLRDKLRQFEISRFAEGNDQDHTRFGSAHIVITAFFRNENPAKFDIKKPLKIGNTITIDGKSGRFTLKGDITDSETKSIGILTLHDSSKKEDALIYYRAYRGKKPKVRIDSTRPMVQGSAFERQVNFLREKTFPWVHNFSVLRGSSSYVTDLVRTISVKADTHKDLPAISLSGESKETGDQDWDVDVKTSEEADDGKAVTGARLVGNSDESTQRTFAVTLKDPESQEENTVMVEIEEENPEAPAAVDPADEPIEYVGDQFTPLPSEPKQPSAPGTSDPGKAAEPSEPTAISQSTAYLVSNTSLPRTGRMLVDYERNRSIPGVRAAIASYQKNSGKKGQLQRFFYYANPFRSIMESVGSAYDVSPAYAYVTVIESAYFTGGQYKIQRPRTKSGHLLSSALGPFQLLEGTARAQGLRVTALWKGDHNSKDDDQDDRNYFTTSACGAANYMTKLVNIFANSDTSLAILAYKEGEGGAAAAAYCTKTRNQSCINRINRGMSGSEYGRYLKVAKNYNYTYAELDRAAMIPPRMRDYVRNKLAAYFIASDLRRYGFTPYGRSSLPKHKSVHSPYSIQDARCKSAVTSLNL